MSVVQYWKGCGPDCCRCHCDCEQVQEYRRELEALPAPTPEELAEAMRLAREKYGWLVELEDADEKRDAS